MSMERRCPCCGAYCGAYCGEEAAVCPRCGEPLDGGAAEAPEERQFSPEVRARLERIDRARLGVLVGLVAVLALAVVLTVVLVLRGASEPAEETGRGADSGEAEVFAAETEPPEADPDPARSGSGSDQTPGDADWVLPEVSITGLIADDGNTYYVGGGGTLGGHSGWPYSSSTSLYGDTFLMMTQSEELYRITADGVAELDLGEGIADYIASAGGQSVIYYWEDADGMSVCRYDLETGEEMVIREGIADFVISPDVRTLAYTLAEDGNAYVQTGDDVALVGRDLELYMVSDGGEYVYYQVDDCLYCWMDGEVVELGVTTGFTATVANLDLSQVLYTTAEEVRLFSRGEVISLVSGRNLSFIGVTVVTPPLGVCDHAEGVQGDIMGSGDFAGKIIQDNMGRNLYRIGEDYTVELVASTEGIRDYWVSLDGSTLLMHGSDSLYLYDVESGGRQIITDEGPELVSAGQDLERVYWITVDEQLYTWTREDGPRPLAGGIDDMAVDAEGRLCYALDGQIHYSADGEDPAPLEGLEPVTGVRLQSDGRGFRAYSEPTETRGEIYYLFNPDTGEVNDAKEAAQAAAP